VALKVVLEEVPLQATMASTAQRSQVKEPCTRVVAAPWRAVPLPK
jgi:hypothetical protein